MILVVGYWLVESAIQLVRQAHVCKQGCLIDDRCHADSRGESSEAQCHFNCVLMVALLSISLAPLFALPLGSFGVLAIAFASMVIERNLVDPASSHMLVSKIKPCMSRYKLLYGKTVNGSLKQLQFI